MGNTTKEFTVENGSYTEVLQNISNTFTNKILELAAEKTRVGDLERALLDVRIEQLRECDRIVNDSQYADMGYELTHAQIVWLGGVFSCSGSIGRKTVNGKLVPELSIRLSDRTVIEQIAVMLRVKVYELKNSKFHSRYRASLGGKNAIRILNLIYPFTFGSVYAKIGTMLREEGIL